jgi:hypothetical protein
MRNSRESIYNALLAYLKTILPSNQVQTFSRVWRPHTDYTAAQLPACVLDEKKEKAEVERLAAAPLYHLYVDLWLYLAAPAVSQIPGQETVIPMTALNNLLDLLESSPLSNPPTGGMPYNTLGGLVQHVWIEGDILKVAGIASSTMQYNLARVPIVIFTT